MKSKQLKHDEAEKRHEQYAALKSAERIRIVQARRGESKKELARLQK